MRTTLFAALLAIASLPACKSKSSEPAAADNTAKNARDKDAVPTADNAVKGGSDLEITQKVRKAIMDDSALSTNAHNCKIVVEHGTVTLVGPVASDAERTRVAEIATQASGGQVVNQLEVAK